MSDATHRPPLPPFTLETVKVKVQGAEDAWNTGDSERIALAYTEDSNWRIVPNSFVDGNKLKLF